MDPFPTAPLGAALCLSAFLGALPSAARAPFSGVRGETSRAQETRTAEAWLQWAVDEPTPNARAAAAGKLSALDGFSIEDWLGAAAAFSPRGDAPEAGTVTVNPDLHVAGSVEATEIEVYVPGAYDHGTPGPLIVALHGTGGAGRHEVRFWHGLADATGAVVIGPSEAGPNGGYRGDERERDAVHQAIRWARREFNVDETRVWMTGYSRGGHIAWDFALRSGDVIAGAIPQAGGPLFGSDPASSPLRMLANLKGMHVHSFVGENDQPTLHGNLALVSDYVRKEKLEGIVLDTLAGEGHAIPNQGQRDWDRWAEGARRESWPTSITRAAFRLEDAERAWIRTTKFNGSVVATYQPTVRAPRGKKLSQAEIRERVLKDAIRKTSLVEAKRLGNGRFQIRASGVAQLTVLLRDDWMPAKGKKLTIRVNRRNQTVRVARSKEVLLRSFVERFDRTFLPVAEASVTIKGR